MNRREAFRQIGSGAMLGALAGVTVTAVSCQPTLAPAAEADPLLELIEDYRRNMAIYNASDDMADDEADALAEATWHPAYDRLCEDPPTPTTLAGALAGIRLVHDEEVSCGYQPSLTINVLRVSLAYFQGA